MLLLAQQQYGWLQPGALFYLMKLLQQKLYIDAAA
jgi:hypothetical protein